MKTLITALLLFSATTSSWGEKEDVLYCVEHGITLVDSRTSRYKKANDGIKSTFKLTENHVQEANEPEKFDIVYRDESKVIATFPISAGKPSLRITRVFINDGQGNYTFLDSQLSDERLFASGGTCTKF